MLNQNEAEETISFLLDAAVRTKRDKTLIKESCLVYEVLSEFISIDLENVSSTAILAALLIVAHDLCEPMRKIKIKGVEL